MVDDLMNKLVAAYHPNMPLIKTLTLTYFLQNDFLQILNFNIKLRMIMLFL